MGGGKPRVLDDILDAGVNVWQPIETCPWGQRDVLLLRYPPGVCHVWPATNQPVTATHWAELPPPPGSTTPDALAVALDWAEEHDDYPVTLRQRIAALVPKLQIVSPWLTITEDGNEEARFELGPQRGMVAEIHVNNGSLSMWVEGRAAYRSWRGSRNAARHEADEALRRAGYLLMP